MKAERTAIHLGRDPHVVRRLCLALVTDLLKVKDASTDWPAEFEAQGRARGAEAGNCFSTSRSPGTVRASRQAVQGRTWARILRRASFSRSMALFLRSVCFAFFRFEKPVKYSLRASRIVAVSQAVSQAAHWPPRARGAGERAWTDFRESASKTTSFTRLILGGRPFASSSEALPLPFLFAEREGAMAGSSGGTRRCRDERVGERGDGRSSG